MLCFRRKILVCIPFAIFVIILLQELIVLDKFKSTFPNETKQINCESNRATSEQIDFVYTWVNGSDPHLKKLIKLYQQLDATDQCADIVETPFLLVIPELIPSTYERLVSSIPKTDLKQWIPVDYEIANDISSSLFFFEDTNKVRQYLLNKKPDVLYNYKLYQLYFARAKCNETDKFVSIKLKNTIKINKDLVKTKQTESQLLDHLIDILSPNAISKKIKRSKLINYRFEFANFDIVAFKSDYKVNGLEVLGGQYSKYELEFKDQNFDFKLVSSDLKLTRNDDAYGKNRFNDKDELKYSLRSVEKYANWFRNIYIVTNGQVPDWLNTTHPKIRIVQHQDIYPNRSHLPTFNSASIESHLHRIKGLSEKFIYLNDDFMFGQPVYLEDFYSRSKGYLIRLGWSAPKCAPNCPTVWLQDGICDNTCNTSMCLFDGGDCLQDKTATTEIVQNIIDRECKTGCQSMWLADEHCDRQCNNLECGFDLGDCKLDRIDTAFQGANYFANQTVYKIKINQNHRGVYLNMTNYFQKLKSKRNFYQMLLKSNNQKHIKKLKFHPTRNLIFLMLDELADSSNSKFTFNITFQLDFNPTNHSIVLELDRVNLMTGSDRKLMDFYADSISYSNYVISKKFKIQNRKVPAHMPILLDRNILERMNVELSDEIEETSSHRFRNSHDLQFAFTYFYFLMSEQYYPTLEQILFEYDRNMDEKLNKIEARTFYLVASKSQFDEKNFENFWNESIECSKDKTNQVAIRTLVNCIDFDFLSDEVKERKKNKFVTLKADDVSFNQIKNDVSNLLPELDKVRKSPAQFICINDNFSDRETNAVQLVNELLHDFYDSLLPLKSEFEKKSVNQIQAEKKFKHESPAKIITNNYKIPLLIFIVVCALISLCSRNCFYRTKRKFSSINSV